MTTRYGSATVTTPTDTTIEITRTFDAPANLVFDAWTRPEHVRRWWGDDEMPVVSAEIDLRVGGRWRYVVRGPDGAELGWHGTYREIERPDRLVSTEVFEGYPDAEAMNTLTLVQAQGTTTMTVRVQHASRENRDGHLQSGMEPGMQRALDRVERLLAEDLGTDPSRDLVLERVIEVPPRLVWEAWTTPEHVVHWFAPVPWTVPECQIDLRPGGAFFTVMQSPDGERYPSAGCYLEVVPERRLVFTDALGPGYRPSATPFFTAALSLTPFGAGTRYRVVAMHGSEETRAKHVEMGFYEGWSTVVDQLVAYLSQAMGGKR